MVDQLSQPNGYNDDERRRQLDAEMRELGEHYELSTTTTLGELHGRYDIREAETKRIPGQGLTGAGV